MSDLGNKSVFSKNIKKFMEINNVDRYQLADALDVKYTTLTDWINGNSYPRIDKIEMIANYFNVNKSALIEEWAFNDPTEDKTIKIINNKLVKLIPILGKIPAGVPFEAIENEYTVDYETIPAEWTKGNKQYFALKVQGNSMEPIYKNGSTVIFLKTSNCESGQDCCVRINGCDATFKRVTKKEDGILLTPLNVDNDTGFLPKLYKYEDMENTPVEIIGVAKRFIQDI